MRNKKAYFQGGGGVNEPEPKKKKYPVEPAILVQPRFEEPFYRNYDLYDTEGVDGPAKYGPGSGWNHMDERKSIKDFLEFRRKRLDGKYVADDSWIQDTPANYKQRVEKMKVRAAIFSRIIKTAGDENDGPNFDYGKGLYSNMDKYKSVKDFEEHADKGPGAFFADDGDDNDIDFPVDDDVNHDTLIRPEEGQYHPPRLVGPSGTGDLATQPGDEGSTETQIEFTTPQIAGEHSYLPLHDFDGRSDDALNFGRDYDDESSPVGRTWDDSEAWDDLDAMLEPAEAEIYGLPDGVEGSAKDADQTIQTENPYDTISDAGEQMYEDKWNI